MKTQAKHSLDSRHLEYECLYIGWDRSVWHMKCCHHYDIMMTIDMTGDIGYK